MIKNPRAFALKQRLRTERWQAILAGSQPAHIDRCSHVDRQRDHDEKDSNEYRH
ncbi:hypothetical protein D3C83_240090 [compost metagenome]